MILVRPGRSDTAQRLSHIGGLSGFQQQLINHQQVGEIAVVVKFFEKRLINYKLDIFKAGAFKQ